MYTKNIPEPDGGAQSFRRGGYQIPASYAGNAFQTELSPDETARAAPEIPAPREDIHTEEAAQGPSPAQAQAPADASGLLAKLGSPSLDDVLLIGLILLLSRERESSTGTLLLLALLLLT